MKKLILIFTVIIYANNSFADENQARKEFNMFDKNRDGSISREEYLAFNKADNASTLFTCLDANHDLSISFEEAHKVCVLDEKDK